MSVSFTFNLMTPNKRDLVAITGRLPFTKFVISRLLYHNDDCVSLLKGMIKRLGRFGDKLLLV